MDFSKRFAKLSDEQIRELGQKVAEHTPESFKALQTEFAKCAIPFVPPGMRKQASVLEVLSGTYKTEAGGVAISGKIVYFPNLCPSCLSVSPTKKVKISSVAGKSKNRLFFRIFRTSHFEVPFCAKCAKEVGRARLVWQSGTILLLVLGVALTGILSDALGIDFRLLALIFAAGMMLLLEGPWVSLFRKMGLRLDRGISIVSTADDDVTHFLFDSEAYKNLFVSLNLVH